MLWYVLFVGISFSFAVSFADSFSWRILNAFYRKSRKSITQKWKYIFKIRSFCENCSLPVKSIYLIPILGCLLAKLKCSHCGLPLSKRFLYLELIGFLYGCVLGFWNPNALFLFFSIFYFVLIYLISYIDWEFMLIPTESILALFILSTAEFFLIHEASLVHIFISISWYSLFHLVRILSKYKLGLADVRLIFPLSLGLGYPMSVFLPTLASVLGILFYLFSTKIKTKSIVDKGLKTKLPFGVFLGIAFLILRAFNDVEI